MKEMQLFMSSLRKRVLEKVKRWFPIFIPLIIEAYVVARGEGAPAVHSQAIVPREDDNGSESSLSELDEEEAKQVCLA
jgi:hypothetical protein